MRTQTQKIRVLEPEAERERLVRGLRVIRHGQPVLELPLYPDVEYVFGRSGESSVVFSDDAVSRQHGRLWCDASLRWVYRDLASSNGTYRCPHSQPDARLELKGSTPVPVQVGDELWLGTERARLVLLGEPPQGTHARTDARVVSKAAQVLEQRLAAAACHELPVVLIGPSGAGKTWAARRIHERSGRKGPFILVNCGALPRDASALQSELLGHVRGAYTGATSERRGKFFAADNGTLFLDEVESMPREAQDFLLDVLEGTGVFSPLGAPADARHEAPRFRLISATKTQLGASALRKDLVQRLLGDHLVLPTLADRRDDIPGLVHQFLAALRAERNLDADLTPEALALLLSRPWPGQVRELKRVIDATIIQQAAQRQASGLDTERLLLGVEALAAYFAEQAQVLGEASSPVALALEEPPPTRQHARKRPADITREEVEAALAQHGGNKTHAARALGMALNTLKAKLKSP
ncbi:MAG: sigma 54-interacting transcriptional regulator [Myxococcaceae bacterium]|nr:sigma 54-interacting transcriptional regulator [Myxococcaceae bacterium]